MSLQSVARKSLIEAGREDDGIIAAAPSLIDVV